MKNFIMWCLENLKKKEPNEDWDFKTREEFDKLSDDDKFRYQHGLPILGSNTNHDN